MVGFAHETAVEGGARALGVSALRFRRLALLAATARIFLSLYVPSHAGLRRRARAAKSRSLRGPCEWLARRRIAIASATLLGGRLEWRWRPQNGVLLAPVVFALSTLLWGTGSRPSHGHLFCRHCCGAPRRYSCCSSIASIVSPRAGLEAGVGSARRRLALWRCTRAESGKSGRKARCLASQADRIGSDSARIRMWDRSAGHRHRSGWAARARRAGPAARVITQPSSALLIVSRPLHEQASTPARPARGRLRADSGQQQYRRHVLRAWPPSSHVVCLYRVVPACTRARGAARRRRQIHPSTAASPTS